MCCRRDRCGSPPADASRICPAMRDGAWWVQDAAAALPVRLARAGRRKVGRRSVRGAGRQDGSARRSRRRCHGRRSLRRAAEAAEQPISTGCSSRLELVEADAATWAPGRTFDAVLLDAPCTSTGTIRRHPDILRLKRPDDVAALADVQARLLDNAARLVAPGGTLLYCTCSLEPEEGVPPDRALSSAQRRIRALADCLRRAVESLPSG